MARELVVVWKTLTVGASILILGYLPVYWIVEDSAGLSSDEISCGKVGAAVNIDNPLERLVTVALAATHKTGNSVYVTAYTLFGFPISKFKSNCDDGSSRRL